MENKKLEAIKNAYGESWEQVKDYVDQNGWIKYLILLENDNIYKSLIFNILLENNVNDLGITFVRPESLKGIENNNGWIKIESENDLPKEGMCEMILLDKECIEGYRNYDIKMFYEVCTKFRKNEISHYKQIIKSQPPIY